MSASVSTRANAALGPELVLSVKDYLQSIGTAKDHQLDDAEGGISKIRLVLASQSPRRKEILDMMGLENLYQVIPSPVNEAEIQNQLRGDAILVDPVVYVRTLAEQKALAVAQELPQSAGQFILVLGSDTIVVMDDTNHNTTLILEKPTDTNDAIQMLRRIQGQSHTVYTGVSVVRVAPNEVPVVQSSFVETAMVHICRMSETDIERYVATGEPMDKAGAYGIQGIGGQIVSSIQGDFFTVRGDFRCMKRNIVVTIFASHPDANSPACFLLLQGDGPTNASNQSRFSGRDYGHCSLSLIRFELNLFCIPLKDSLFGSRRF